MPGKYVSPTITQSAFNCPHCEALTTQFWYTVHSKAMDEGALPIRINEITFEQWNNLDDISDVDFRKRITIWKDKMVTGLPFLEEEKDLYCRYNLYNVSLSRCYNCNNITIWINDKIWWPQVGTAPSANPDLPSDVRDDYNEASTILNLSPRGSSALLRLAIQKLCRHLGEKGHNINDDIASLVEKGLDVRVQRALDVVRVVGNNAVHPGAMDLRDDRATAEKLFTLVNLIAERMISEPKHVSELYDSLPESALKAIAKRDS